MNKLFPYLIGSIVLTIAVVGVFSPAPVEQQQEPVGGFTKTRIGSQTYWTTDLVPSGSFTVDLGSATSPVQDLFTTNASISGDFEVSGTASISTLTLGNALDIGDYTNLTAGATGIELDGDDIVLTTNYFIPLTASASDWDAFEKTPSTVITAGDNISWDGNTLNATGGGGGTDFIGVNVTGGTFQRITSISFEPLHFDYANTASNAFISLDWTNGPASRAADESITGSWTFATATVSSNLEIGGFASISNILLQNRTLTTGAGNYGNLVFRTRDNPGGATGDFELITGDATGGGSGSIYITLGLGTSEGTFDIDGNSGGIKIGVDHLTSSRELFFADRDMNFDTPLFSYASVSSDFEIGGFASASKYFGATLADCDNATTSKLLWSDTGLFSCGTDQTGGGGGASIEVRNFPTLDSVSPVATISFEDTFFSVRASGSADVTIKLASDSLDFTQLIDNATLDAVWNIASAGYGINFNDMSIQSDLFNLSETSVSFPGLGGSVTGNAVIGQGAGAAMGSADVDNVLIGMNAGGAISGTGTDNTCVGDLACDSITSGDYNTLIGSGSDHIAAAGGTATAVGYNTISGVQSVAMGSEAEAPGAGSVAIGSQAGYDSGWADIDNVLVGFQAGFNIAGTSTDNTCIGDLACDSLTSGDQNVLLGAEVATALTTGTGNIIIGYQAGALETGSNTLYIENSNAASSSALIYGEFDNDYLLFNASASVSSNFEIGAEKFRVAGSTGNTIIAGTLGVTGLSSFVNASVSNGLEVTNYMKIPNAAGGPTLDQAGKIGLDTASGSFNAHDGTAERVIAKGTKCMGLPWDSPAVGDDDPFFTFIDPFTITEIKAVASSSVDAVTSVGFQMTHGVDLSSQTNLFAAAHNASSSTTNQSFTSFADATLVDGSILNIKISSVSTEVQSILFTICGRWDN